MLKKLPIFFLVILMALLSITSVSCSSKTTVVLRAKISNADPVGPNHKLMGVEGYEYPLLLIVPIEERGNVSVRTEASPGEERPALKVFMGENDRGLTAVEVPTGGIIDTEIRIEPGTYVFYAANYVQYDSLEYRAPIVLLRGLGSGNTVSTMTVVGDEEGLGMTKDLGITYFSQP